MSCALPRVINRVPAVMHCCARRLPLPQVQEAGSRSGTPRVHYAIRLQATPVGTPRAE